MCFVHVLLNALDMAERGWTAQIVLEGRSPELVAQLQRQDNAFHALWTRAQQGGLVAGACRACSSKLGVQASVEAAGVALLDGMSGHPSMAAWMADGYEVLTF